MTVDSKVRSECTLSRCLRFVACSFVLLLLFDAVIDSGPRHSTSATIPAGTPADQQPDKDDDELSLSSLSSISSHPVLSEPTAAELGPVGSSFWVPPPVMADVPPDSPAHDSACLPPFPALFCSHVSSPQRLSLIHI